MNHQGLLWKVHSIATVVLRKQSNFKSMVLRAFCYKILYEVANVTISLFMPNECFLLDNSIFLAKVCQRKLLYSQKQQKMCLFFFTTGDKRKKAKNRMNS